MEQTNIKNEMTLAEDKKKLIEGTIKLVGFLKEIKSKYPESLCVATDELLEGLELTLQIFHKMKNEK